MKTIKKKAFSRSSIESISIPSNVDLIEKLAFYQCYKLEKVKFVNGSKINKISKQLFSETLLKSIEIPSQVTIIETEAFQFCHQLEKVNFSKY